MSPLIAKIQIIMKKQLTLILFVATTIFAEDTPKFVITAPEEKSIKLASANTLKQELGDEIKETLKEITQLNRHLGKIQKKIADLQDSLLENGEKLLNNSKPYKKASKKDLNAALKTAQSAHTQLKEIETSFESCVCLKA